FDHPDSTATSVVIYGDYPDIKDAYEKLGISVEVRKNPHMKVESLTMNVQVGVTPELQQFIDDAKAECAKVVAENTELKNQISVYEQANKDHSELLSENSRLKDALLILENQCAELKAQLALGNESPASRVETTDTNYESWTVPQIKDFLASKEIGFKSSASKDELLALIPKE
ncbi:hypothetical protein, partial [Acinetobacter gerneri]